MKPQLMFKPIITLLSNHSAKLLGLPLDSLRQLVLTAAFCLALATTLHAQVATNLAPAYRVVDLGSLPGGADFSEAMRVNDVDQVIGISGEEENGTEQGFIWNETNGMIGLGDFGASSAKGLNNEGLVVGQSDGMAFLWDSTNGLRHLGLLDGNPDGVAFGISDGGAIACMTPSTLGPASTSAAYLLAGGTATWIGELFPGSSTAPESINNKGEIAGISSDSAHEEAFFWNPSTGIVGLGGLPGYTSGSAAWGINGASQVVGSCWNNQSYYGQSAAFIWTSGTGMAELRCSGIGGTNAEADAISPGGIAVGYCQIAGTTRAVAWTPGQEAVDLNGLIVDLSGWAVISYARGVNSAGVIVGLGIRTNGAYHACIMYPLSAPSITNQPSIVSQPANQTVIAGATASFHVAANGTAPLSYQWFFSQTNQLTGATNASLNITNAQPANAGGYSVLVTNVAGSVTSSIASLTVIALPQTPRIDSFTITDLGTLGGTSSEDLGLNNLGEVVGWADTANNVQRAFVYSGGVMKDIGTLGGITSTATGINDLGQIVGVSDTSGGQVQGFLFRGGIMNGLGTLGGNNSYAEAINNNGQITGYSDLPGNAQHHTFLYSGGNMQDIGPLGTTSSEGYAINASGQIAGELYGTPSNQDYRDAFVYSGGPLVNLGVISGRNSVAYGINNLGQVVGGSDANNATTSHAFVTHGTTLQDLGLIGPFGRANAINNSGQIVGDNQGSPFHAALFNAGAIIDLNTIIPPNSGWDLEEATAINDLGEIVGYGIAPDGRRRAYLLTPSSAVQKQPIITWTNPTDIIYGTTLGSNQLNAIANVAGSFAYTPAAGTVLQTGTGQVLRVNYTPSDTNYTPASASVKINVLKAKITVAADHAKRSYGASNPVFQATISGLVNGDTSSVISGIPSFTCLATLSSPVGNYDIVPAFGILSAENYRFGTFTRGILIVEADPLLISITNRTRAYGDQNPIFTGALTGLLNNDAISLLFKCDARTNSSIGSYSIVPSPQDPNGRLGNYTVTTNLGTLRITPATLTVRAASATRPYGETNPVFTGTLMGLRNADPITVSYDCDAGPTSAPGAYSIVPSLLDPAGRLPNYSVVNQNGTLTIAAAIPASLHGVANDALSKQPLAGVTVRLGNLSQTTGPDGAFAFTNLAPGGLHADFTANPTMGPAPLTVQFSNTTQDGAYVLQAEKTGYALYSYAPIELAAGEDKQWNFSLSPSLEGLRLVLNWGAYPRDLDSHLWTPKINGTNYHIQYSSRYFGQTNRPPFAQLDADATTGYGPETITIASNVPGIYRYFVHNYKEDQGDTGELTISEAVVQIYSTAGLIQTVRVPIVGAGDYWDVCAIDGASGKITLISQIVTSEPQPIDGGTVPPGSGDNGGGNTNNQPKLVWSFGDGNTSDQINPTDVYTNGGTYTVSMQITMPDGRIATATQPGLITVTGSTENPPQLTIARSGTNVLISWRTTDSGYVLESRSSLFTGAWAAVTQVPQPGPGNTYSVRIPMSGQQFFTLRK